MRLGHGIIQTPPNINHPARIAERVATLDLMSGGRTEFGTGSGATLNELGGFNVPQPEKKAMQIEGMRVAVRMLVEEPFTGFEGKYLKVPPRNVLPKPKCESETALAWSKGHSSLRFPNALIIHAQCSDARCAASLS